jgi:hypothetical protein
MSMGQLLEHPNWPLKSKRVNMILKNSVPSSKKTQYFTITVQLVNAV